MYRATTELIWPCLAVARLRATPLALKLFARTGKWNSDRRQEIGPFDTPKARGLHIANLASPGQGKTQGLASSVKLHARTGKWNSDQPSEVWNPAAFAPRCHHSTEWPWNQPCLATSALRDGCSFLDSLELRSQSIGLLELGLAVHVHPQRTGRWKRCHLYGAHSSTRQSSQVFAQGG